MSKISFVDLDDEHMKLDIWDGLVSAFHLASKVLPEAIIVTEAQAKKYFYQAGAIMSSFRGIPLELQKQADQRETVKMTVDGILSGMHQSGVKDVHEVYRMLEQMKEKI